MRIRSRAKHRIRRKKLGRPFWRLWAGFTLASTGDGMLTGAVPLLAVYVNPHPLAVSSVVAADRIPWLLLALPAGAFADKFSRGPLMAITNVLRAASIAIGAFLILSGHITLATLDPHGALQRGRPGDLLLLAASRRSRHRAVGRLGVRQRPDGRHRDRHGDPRRTGRRNLVLRHEQGAPVLRRRRRVGAVVHSPSSASDRRPPNPTHRPRPSGRASGSSGKTAACAT